MESSLNTAWLLLGTALIFFMQGGFAMLEAGLTRKKNAGNIVMKNLLDFSIGAPLYLFLGFGIMYGSANSIFGSLDFFAKGDYSDVLPEGISLYAFLIWQTAFAATSATIVSGAMAERTKFSAYCIFSAVITMLIYPVSGHWIWGGGWLMQMGFHDLAGSTAVHLVGGTAAFMGAYMLGPRIGKYDSRGNSKAIMGQSMIFSALGIFILWFCWFGFNGSSLYGITGGRTITVGKIFLNTNLSAAVSVVTAMIFTRIRYGKPDVTLTFNAALGGLVAITSGADVMSPVGAFLTGFLAGLTVVLAVEFIDRRLHVDDPVGAVAAHGCCGFLGTLLTGLLSTQSGLFYGYGGRQFAVQLIGAIAVLLWSGCTSFIAFKLIDLAVGLRVTAREEMEGLDSWEHGVPNAYAKFMPEVRNYTGRAGDSELKGVAVRDVPVDEAIPIHGSLERREDTTLTKLEIICKESKFDDLKKAMNDIGVTGMTVSHVLGCGIQKGATEYYRGIPVDIQLLPKVEVDIVVAKVPVEQVVNAARKALYTGHIGDGKIFIYDLRDAVKVRTGETGYSAMQGLDIV